MKKIIFMLVGFIMCSCSQAETKDAKSASVIKLLQKEKPVQICNQIIYGDINFAAAGTPVMAGTQLLQNVVESNIVFANCIFFGEISANSTYEKAPVITKFNGNVIFYNCDFRGNVNFDNAVVCGKLDFQKSKFRENASFNNMYVETKTSYFSEVEAEKKFSMVYSTFLGNLFFINASFADNFTMQETVVNEKLMFTNAKSASTDLGKISVRGRSLFNYSDMGGVSFMSARFYDDVEMKDIKYSKVEFEKSSFYGRVLVNDTVSLENAYILKR